MTKNFTKNIEERIFIAGSNGMVGKAIKRAYQKKYNVQNSSKKIILEASRRELDLSNFLKVESWFKKNRPDIVILAAAKVGGILANQTFPSEFILENLKIQTNLIEISYKYNVKKFLFLGSSCIYPKFANQPIKEDELLTNALEPTNQFYAIAKITGIKLCEALNTQYGFHSICLMPTNLYGPGDNYHKSYSHVLPSLIKKFSEAKKLNKESVTCWGTGNPLREFLYVDDLADACLFAIDNWDPKSKESPKDNNGKPLYWLNVGSNSEISIKKLAEMISNLVGFEGKIIWDKSKPDGTPRKKLDATRMSKLGWNSKTSLNKGIQKTLIDYENELKNNSIRD